MADRYYLPEEQTQELSQCLAEAEASTPVSLADAKNTIDKLVADVRNLVFATEIPDDIADELERSLDNALTGLSI